MVEEYNVFFKSEFLQSTPYIHSPSILQVSAHWKETSLKLWSAGDFSEELRSSHLRPKSQVKSRDVILPKIRVAV